MDIFAFDFTSFDIFGSVSPPSGTITYLSETTIASLDGIAFDLFEFDSFAHLKNETNGNWYGVYGSEGYVVTGDIWSGNELQSLPVYLTGFTATGYMYHTWASTTDDTRALQEPDNLSDHIAACWQTDDIMTFNFVVGDFVTHNMHVYFLNWDGASRDQTVLLMRTSDSTILYKNTINSLSFTGGMWISYDFNENVTLSISRTSGTNAVLSGFFFDTYGKIARGFRSPPFW